MRQGDTRGAGVDFFDFTYDGSVQNGYLSGGLGQLVDFEEGGKEFRHDAHATGKKGFEWVGWKNETTPPHEGAPVELVFSFDTVRNFTQVTLHAHNYYSKDIRVFRQAQLYFSVGGEHYTQEPVTYHYMPDNAVEYARRVHIAIPNRIGAFVKLRLFYDARWIMLSEVRFTNGEFALPPSRPRAISISFYIWWNFCSSSHRAQAQYALVSLV